MKSRPPSPPLIVHLVHRFATGGIENGLANLINRLPPEFAHHHVMGLTGIDPRFSIRIKARHCSFEDIGLRAGRQSLTILPTLLRRFRELRPTVVHTRNLATLECQLAAWMAGVPVRIHGEHGWDESDRYGSRRRYTALRRALRHFVHQQVALSRPTADYLRTVVGVPVQGLREINNGVDTGLFAPPDQWRRNTNRLWSERSADCPDWPYAAGEFIIGSVGRLSGIKNQQLLIRAFLALREQDSEFCRLARLALIGDGPDRRRLEQQAAAAHAGQMIWFAGDRHDVPDLLRRLDVFVLCSRAEGLSNSILEAMATGLPIVATDVGGNRELIEDGNSGTLIADDDIDELKTALHHYFHHPCDRITHGCTARDRVLRQFSIGTMVEAYANLYRDLLAPVRLSPPMGHEIESGRVI